MLGAQLATAETTDALPVVYGERIVTDLHGARRAGIAADAATLAFFMYRVGVGG